MRVSSSDLQGVFVVIATRGDTLSLRASAPPQDSLAVPIGLIDRLEVRRERSRPEGFVRGAGVGALAGGALGALVGLAAADNDESCWIICGPAETASFFALIFGIPGAATGGVIGAVRPGERWQRLEPPVRLGVSIRRNGAVTVAFSSSF